jgi:hypothetical protein
MTYIQQKTSGEMQNNNNNNNSINIAITTITTDKIGSTPYSERLELAVLFFFEQFRRQYIGDHGRSNKIYQVLFKHLGKDMKDLSIPFLIDNTGTTRNKSSPDHWKRLPGLKNSVPYISS